ncbi:MAG: gamma-glutamyltransferase [Calditrichaeota bacterium]|nr:MAG: gamma-glutamyltransferase [Calditrichota bacterium]
MGSQLMEKRKIYHLLVSIFLTLFIIFGDFSKLFAQDVFSDTGMVASAQPLASQAGVEILKKGGNAVDAAVATAFALGVVEPNASGLGGGGFMVIKLTTQPEAVNIDFREMAPGKADSAYYYSATGSFNSLTGRGANSAGVPGIVAGLALALEKYGTLTLGEVMDPAIRYAREGFAVSENFSGIIFQNYDLIMQYPATAAVYLKDDLPVSQGSIIRNPMLAFTMETLAAKGYQEFYRGEMAIAMQESIKKYGGILNAEDLQGYRTVIRQPVKGTYRGYEIISAAPPTGGGIALIELLNILENFPIHELSPDSVSYYHLLAEAMKIVFADKAGNIADPDFYRVPVEKLTSKQYAASRLRFLDTKKVSIDYKAPAMIEKESGSTTHISVVDRNRNIVALTQSINNWFGSGITVEGTGILLNNHLKDFENKAGHPNSIEPYKRPVSSIAPTIILKDDQPFISFGTPGGTRIISALAQILINVIDFEMTMDEAIEAPRIHASGSTLHLEGRISEKVRHELESRGHRLKVHDDFDNYFGGAQGIFIDNKKGNLTGGADSRRDGVVAGY